jgi:hypothetical protein
MEQTLRSMSLYLGFRCRDILTLTQNSIGWALEIKFNRESHFQLRAEISGQNSGTISYWESITPLTTSLERYYCIKML